METRVRVADGWVVSQGLAFDRRVHVRPEPHHHRASCLRHLRPHSSLTRRRPVGIKAETTFLLHPPTYDLLLDFG